MKNYIIIIILFAIYVGSTSCEKMFGDFLEKAPGVDFTEDTVFSSQVQVEKFLAACYMQGIPAGYGGVTWKVGSSSYTNNLYSCFGFSDGGSCDEGEWQTGWMGGNVWGNANIIADNAYWEEIRYEVRWSAIRMCNMMLERIDGVPGMDQTYKDQIKGEVKFLRAYNYAEALKIYGGIPILRKRFDPNEFMNVPRNSIDSVVNFIVRDLDEAAAILPDAYTANYLGRATKGCALILKSRTLLYAASPLFNSATPYKSMDNPENNKLLCLGTYDLNRWKIAADAAKAVLDWAPAGGISLVTDQGTDKNYRYVWEVKDNREIILADKLSNANLSWTSHYPPNLGGGAGGGMNVNLNFVEKFYYNRYTGKKVVWYSTGNDLLQKYDSLDYRFKQTVGYVNSFWNTATPVVNLYLAGNGFPEGSHYGSSFMCMWLHKWIPYSSNTGYNMNFTLFRLAEAYLNYAEALNEFSGPSPEAYAAVNIIRTRSGMPDLPAGLTQAQFRDRVREERAVELAWEGHRFYDIMRWKIALDDGVMVGDFYGLKVYKLNAVPTFSYQRYLYEKRVFNPHMFLRPFKLVDVNKSKGVFIQNPGY